MRPALKVVPEGKWECDECVDRAFVEAKDYIIRNSRLYERVDNYGKKVSSAEGHTSRGGASGHKVAEENGSEGNRSSDKQANSTASPGVRLRATSPVMRIATKLAETISSAFSEDPKKANGNGVGTKERFLLTGAASQGGDTMDVDDEYR